MGEFRKMHSLAENVTEEVIALWQNNDSEVIENYSKSSQRHMVVAILKMAFAAFGITGSIAAAIFSAGLALPAAASFLMLGVSLFSRGLKSYNKLLAKQN